jgi:hypothetical protein
MRRVVLGMAVLIIAAIACSLQGGNKDLCNTDSDCNADRVCIAGTCGPSSASGDAGPTDAETNDADAGSVFQIIPYQGSGGSKLNAVWGADPNHVFAVGENNVRYVYTSGTLSRSGGVLIGQDYNAVWGFAPDDVYAVGNLESGGGFVDHYDGMGWTTKLTTPKGLYGVWGGTGGVAPEFVFVCGFNGTLYWWYTGSDWQDIGPIPPNTFAGVPQGPYDPMLYSIAGTDRNDFAVAAGTDLVLTSGTSGFNTFEPSSFEDTVFRAAWQVPGASPPSLYFGGNFMSLWWLTGPVYGDGGNHAPSFGQLHSESTDGGDLRYVRGLWSTTKTVVGVGDGNRIFTYAIGSQTYLSVPAPTPPSTSLGGVWGSAIDDVWIVGDNEAILHGSLAP